MRLRGSHRRAFVVGGIAIKVPRWGRLREAVRANREEARLWREGWQRFYPELCPVIACLPFGVALVMPAVRLMDPDEFRVFCGSEAYPVHHPDPELYESKLGEWGYLDGKPVVVDYAMRCHMTEEDLSLIDPAVRTIDAVERWFGVNPPNRR